MIKKVVKFETSDGTVCSSLEEAVAREVSSVAEQKLQALVPPPLDGSPSDVRYEVIYVADLIGRNPSVLKEIMDAVSEVEVTE